MRPPRSTRIPSSQRGRSIARLRRRQLVCRRGPLICRRARSRAGGAAPAAAGRPASRASQGHYRPIGLNTLMGVLDRSKRDERRRMMKVVLPVFLVLVIASVLIAVR